jgi:hypothetical protein
MFKVRFSPEPVKDGYMVDTGMMTERWTKARPQAPTMKKLHAQLRRDGMTVMMETPDGYTVYIQTKPAKPTPSSLPGWRGKPWTMPKPTIPHPPSCRCRLVCTA